MDIDEKLIKKLQSYILTKTGKNYFGRIKTTPNDLMVSCPFHKGGQERKPSCGIKRYTDENGSAGTVHCFSCGVTTDINGMLKEILGTAYNSVEVESKLGIQTLMLKLKLKEPPKVIFKIPKEESFVKESILRQFRVYHPYLAQRGISKDTAQLYDIGFEGENKHITFPIKDKYNRCIGVGRRSILEKKYYYPPEMVKPLYGIYELELAYPIHYLWIVEGPFNLWSLSEWGKHGVALLGTGTSFQYQQLKNIKCTGYVLALDPDDAGRNGTLKLIKFLLSIHKSKIYVLDLPNGKDVNDLTQEEFRCLNVLTYKEWQNKYKFF